MLLDRVSSFERVTFFIFRVVIGLLFAQHGLQKLFGLLGGKQAELLSLMGIAGIIELAVGLFVAIGLFTRPFAFLGAVTMVVAYGMVHFPKGLIPIQNGGELALLYFVAFIFLASRKVEQDIDASKIYKLFKG